MTLAGRIVVVQALLGAGSTAAFFVVGAESGKSAGLALMASWLPAAYYAWVQARTFNATRLLMHGVLKTLLTVTFMAVCIVTMSLEPVGFFVTFAVMQLSYLTRDGTKASG